MALGDDFGQVDQEATDGTVSRRALVRRALGLAVATPVVLAVLQACGGDEAEQPAGGGDTGEETGGGEQETGGGAEETQPAMTASSPAALQAAGASPVASPAAGASPAATPMGGASPVASPAGAQAGGQATPAS